MAIRITQEAIEILANSANPPVFITQEAIEILANNPNPPVFLTQEAIEILEVTNIVQIPQQFVDVISRNAPANSLQLAQQFVDVISRNAPTNSVNLSQQFVTVISKSTNYQEPPAKWDFFTGDNDDPPDTNKWTRTQDNGTAKIKDNKLNLVQNVPGNTKVESKFLFGSNFDVKVNAHLKTVPSVSQEVRVSLEVESENGGHDRGYIGAGIKDNLKKVFANAFVNNVDQTVVEDSRTYDILGLRIKRLNGDLYVYVQDGGDWVLKKTVNNWSTKNIIAKLSIYNQVSSNMEADLDDFENEESSSLTNNLVIIAFN